ncbi:hypothetical protein MARLIPOL_06684 [Marinobacter lipolyticus SM19]|uniref:Uncharacterized protein n=1 Tax=Marinobacter lipolyticus SM19 TaxID=1318628 RepID=R8B1F3_9GAMM|nr:hypothetical protein [Marinobacter lipolyticus]EON92416.1 hypothetical protein MARLIPOL_06684 [Marinobacter lipolyticus SM19]
MNTKPFIFLAVGFSLAFSGAAFGTENQLATVGDAKVTPLSVEQMSEVEGMAHTTFPLGALVFDNTNGNIADKPAWDLGLSPDRALGKAQVPGS